MKIKFHKFLYLIILIIGSITEIKSQSIFFNYSDGNTSAYALQDVRKIDFLNEMMNLHLNDGTVYSWSISSIGYYEYSPDTPLKIEDWLGKANDRHVKVFPNPSNGEQTVSMVLPIDEELILQVLDASGKVAVERNLGNLSKGEHIFPLGFTGSVGQYTFILRNTNFSVSKKLIRTL
jgi:hypothetical protein